MFQITKEEGRKGIFYNKYSDIIHYTLLSPKGIIAIKKGKTTSIKTKTFSNLRDEKWTCRSAFTLRKSTAMVSSKDE
jgi:hypothetical protein